MIVQLRRVVYLLVLLQCCVCLANTSATRSNQERSLNDLSAIENKLNEVERRAEELSSGLLSIQHLLAADVQHSMETLSDTTVVVRGAEELIQKAGSGGTDVNESITGDLKEATIKAQMAVANAGSLAKGINKHHLEAFKLEGEGHQVKEELETALKKYLGVAREENHRASASLEKLRVSLEGLQKTMDETTSKKENINTELKSLQMRLKHIEESIRMPPLPGEPQTRGQQEGERTNAVETPGQNTTEGGATPPEGSEGMKENTQSGNAEVNTTTTSNGDAGKQQSHEGRVGNKQIASQENKTPKEPRSNESTEKPENAVPDKQNETQSDKNKEQSAKGKPNETGDSPKPTTPSNTPSGTVNTGSGGVTSGSHSSSSSGTINFNVSGLSDGNVGPALVHSPLLLLLLCVLGCVLVC